MEPSTRWITLDETFDILEFRVSSLPRGLTIPSIPRRSRRHLTVIASMVILTLLLPLLATAQEVPELQITSKHYIVIDADTAKSSPNAPPIKKSQWPA